MIQHISVRIPWHDNGWDGTICCSPSLNSSCLRLKNISENRDDSFENANCLKCMKGKEGSLPCISEGGAFMYDGELNNVQVHPYKEGNPETHGHFLETTVTYPPYSLPGRPYSWLLYSDRQDHTSLKALLHGINYKPDKEPDLCWDGRRPAWIQEACNQKAIFDYFYQDVTPNESLCIVYSKQVPFVEDRRRVVIGVGHVTGITPAVEHNHTDNGSLRSMTWETMISHSIRNDNKDGFIIPYDRMMKYAETDPEFDMSSIVVFAPDDAFDEFSFATEHVKYDSVIEVLVSCIKSYKLMEGYLHEDFSEVINWLKSQLELVWKQRGLFPGLGMMLYVLNFPLGLLIGRFVRESFNDSDKIWDYLDYVIENPKSVLPKDLALSINSSLQDAWKCLSAEDKDYFKFLSRFDLDEKQARVLFNPEERKKENINFSSRDVLDNPYILYEKTRLKNKDLYISVAKVDRAVFPSDIIRNILPLESPTAVVSGDDKRRVRALAVSLLEMAANKGHTIYPKDLLINEIANMPLDPECKLNRFIVTPMESFFQEEIYKRRFNAGEDGEYYKLVRINSFDERIERVVLKRQDMKKIDISVNTDDLKHSIYSLDLPEEKKGNAFKERAAILQAMAESHFFVLCGNAGTGKTTLLSFLCNQLDVETGGVCLIAPTGKAAVRLSEKVKGKNSYIKSYNIAQFLIRSGRYNGSDMRYDMNSEKCDDITETTTVIIDESSMLTVEMLGSLFSAVGRAKRIILVGDPNQLPPIGVGKPFVDIVNLLRPKEDGSGSYVSKNYGELRENLRQQSDNRADVMFSKRFIRDSECIYDDGELIEVLQNKTNHLVFESWKTREELEEKLLNLVSKELGMTNPDDQTGFDTMMGATIKDNKTYFNRSSVDCINEWQILCPIKNMPQGVSSINRLFHLKYRAKQIEMANKKAYERKIPQAFGSDGIVYGDKVINVKNVKKNAYPINDKDIDYVANGEIGIVCDCYNFKDVTVSYSTKPGYTYCYGSDDRSRYNDNTDDILELAYALTVHKAQGSQFGTTILVISEPCRLLSRELLYTALTRQENKIIVLYNQDSSQLLKYASDEYSDIAKRLTDLFVGKTSYVPKLYKSKNTYYDENSIYVTKNGELVKSKSEIFIANALLDNGLKYEYEPELYLGQHKRYPDFKVYDPDTGEIWYWEHCGKMSDPDYVRNWEKKKKLYAEHGIIEGQNLIVTEEYYGQLYDPGEFERIIKDKFLL